MASELKVEPRVRAAIEAATAADLMTPNPASIGNTAKINDAIRFLTGKRFGAAPVIDSAGRPVGVVSKADILIHEGERGAAELSGEAQVRDIMTPAVFSVAPETSVRRVVEEMVVLNVHRLFVVDADGVLVGVISALDVLRRLTF